MIFIYNETGKNYKLTATEKDEAVSIDLSIDGWTSKHNIANTKDPVIKTAALEKFVGTEITKPISRQFMSVKGKIAFDSKTREYVMLPSDATPRDINTHPKNMLVLLLNKGSRFTMNPRDMVGKPIIDNTFSDNIIMIKVLIYRNVWSTLKEPIVSYVDRRHEGTKWQLKMSSMKFVRKTPVEGKDNNYFVNMIYIKEYDGEIPKFYEKKKPLNNLRVKVWTPAEKGKKSQYNKNTSKFNGNNETRQGTKKFHNRTNKYK